MADPLRCLNDSARIICEKIGEWFLPIKANQPALPPYAHRQTADERHAAGWVNPGRSHKAEGLGNHWRAMFSSGWMVLIKARCVSGGRRSLFEATPIPFPNAQPVRFAQGRFLATNLATISHQTFVCGGGVIERLGKSQRGGVELLAFANADLCGMYATGAGGLGDGGAFFDRLHGRLGLEGWWQMRLLLLFHGNYSG